ncbi:MAG: hypothetical protein AAF436_17885 [Myxococcota bacterium]
MARCPTWLLTVRPWGLAALALAIAACSSTETQPGGTGGSATGGTGGPAAGGTGGTGGTGGGPTGGTGGTGGGVFEGRAVEIDEAMRRSDLVFEGEVVDVQYANAVDNGVGEPAAEDGKTNGLPHTFVTYRMAEVFTNNQSEETFTLRFAGGVDTESAPDYDILSVAQHPHFDIGDRDILFVKGNEHALCPLDRCSNGRYRVLSGPNDSEDALYTELGQEIRMRMESEDTARLFAIGHHPIEALLVSSFTMPDGEVITREAVSIDEPGETDPVLRAPAALQPKHSFGPIENGGPPLAEEGDNSLGERLTPDDLRRLIRAFVDAHPDFAWLPTASADPDEPFALGLVLADVTPLSDGLDPEPPVREPDEIDKMEIEVFDALIEEAECQDGTPGEGCDVSPSQETIDEMRGRREAITGVIERPNRRTRDAEEEDMWTDRNEGDER